MEVLGRKANEQMTPEELDEWSSLQADTELATQRKPTLFSKLKYFFFTQSYPSHLATYLELKQ